jgi:lipoprotein-releasing system permease protein
MHEYDSNFAFMPLARLQKIRGMIDPVTGMATVSSIHMRFRPGTDLAGMRDRIESRMTANQLYYSPYIIETWQDSQRPLLSAVDIELTILNILLFLIIAVAGFGILATFYMIVVEKTRDIGILKALGAPSSGIMSIFLNYGLCLGATGTGVGILIGLVFVAKINAIADGIGWMTGRELFDPTMYFFSEIPTIVSPWMVGGVATGAMLIAVMASVLPALRAARMHPVEALRYE